MIWLNVGAVCEKTVVDCLTVTYVALVDPRYFLWIVLVLLLLLALGFNRTLPILLFRRVFELTMGVYTSDDWRNPHCSFLVKPAWLNHHVRAMGKSICINTCRTYICELCYVKSTTFTSAMLFEHLEFWKMRQGIGFRNQQFPRVCSNIRQKT